VRSLGTIIWLKPAIAAASRHPYDAPWRVYTDGDRTSCRKAVNAARANAAWDGVSSLKGVTHILGRRSGFAASCGFRRDEETSAVGGRGTIAAAPALPQMAGGNSCATTSAALVGIRPAACAKATFISRDVDRHRSFPVKSPKASICSRGTGSHDEGVSEADRLYVVDLK